MSQPFAKIHANSAADICKGIRLQDKPADLLKDNPSPREFLDALVKQREYATAVRFLSRALPKRESVWWGSLSLWHAIDSEVSRLSLREQVALKGAVAWVLEPTEERRQPLSDLAKNATSKTAAGLLAKAAFWSGGSMLPANLPVVPPKPELTGRAVSGAVLIAGNLKGMKASRGLYSQFVALGINIADGKNGWQLPPRQED